MKNTAPRIPAHVVSSTSLAQMAGVTAMNVHPKKNLARPAAADRVIVRAMPDTSAATARAATDRQSSFLW